MMIVDYNDKTVFGFNLVDDRQWLCRLFEEEEQPGGETEIQQ